MIQDEDSAQDIIKHRTWQKRRNLRDRKRLDGVGRGRGGKRGDERRVPTVGGVEKKGNSLARFRLNTLPSDHQQRVSVHACSIITRGEQLRLPDQMAHRHTVQLAVTRD